MATYKQKIPTRIQHIEHDSEESEQEWVITSNKPIERRLVNNVSEDEDWHVLSDTSLLEEGTPTFESNSEFASGCSDYDSEHHYVQDETTRSVESFIRKMPSHDGAGNFFNATLSDGSNHESLTSLVDSNLALSSSYSDQENESLSRNLKRSVISNQNISMGRKSWITKFRDVFRSEEDVITTSVSQEQTTQATQQIYHKFAESTSSAAKFELGDLGNTNPIKALANVGNENSNSITYTTVTTQYIVLSSADQKQQTPSQSDKNSLLSTVWTTFCRITNNIIVPDDTDLFPNDFSHSTNLACTSSNHNTGLASIIAGENNYDTCYLPFGNHLTLSELCPSLHNYYKSYSNYSSSSTPSTSSYSKNSIATSKILHTPVSSSTSLKSFTSRAGSDCGLESGGSIGRSTAPLVL